MRIHCIGIGGIGLSALARYYLSLGYHVTGSDSTDSELIETLRHEGIPVTIGQDSGTITDAIDSVVYTIAIADTHEELCEAKRQGIPTKTYPQALGEVTRGKKTIAVSGTHGKTTTTAMMYSAMKACGINPTVIVGSLLSGKGTNFVAGDSDFMIVEACEYKRSFLNLHPTHAVITNIDEDHLDYYKDLDDIKSAFQSFVDTVPVEGTVTTHRDVTISTLAHSIDADAVDRNSIELSVLGEHNRYNAQLVLALLTSLHFDEARVRAGLKEFAGTWRRLEYKGKTLHGIPVYDDYGHHPKEIRASLQALREKYKQGECKLIMLFQPHLYSRTKALLHDFVDVLKDVDEVYILPIYKARLEDTSGINEDIVVDAINQAGGNAKRLQSLADIPAYIESISNTMTVIVNMGAGNAFEELHTITFV